MKYAHIVQYVKDNHISWDTDIFDILKNYTSHLVPPIENKNRDGSDSNSVENDYLCTQVKATPIHSSLLEETNTPQTFEKIEYSVEDVLELFSK